MATQTYNINLKTEFDDVLKLNCYDYVGYIKSTHDFAKGDVINIPEGVKAFFIQAGEIKTTRCGPDSVIIGKMKELKRPLFGKVFCEIFYMKDCLGKKYTHEITSDYIVKSRAQVGKKVSIDRTFHKEGYNKRTDDFNLLYDLNLAYELEDDAKMISHLRYKGEHLLAKSDVILEVLEDDTPFSFTLLESLDNIVRLEIGKHSNLIVRGRYIQKDHTDEENSALLRAICARIAVL